MLDMFRAAATVLALCQMDKGSGRDLWTDGHPPGPGSLALICRVGSSLTSQVCRRVQWHSLLCKLAVKTVCDDDIHTFLPQKETLLSKSCEFHM